MTIKPLVLATLALGLTSVVVMKPAVAQAAVECADYAEAPIYELDAEDVLAACDPRDPLDAVQLARAALFANAFDEADNYLKVVARSTAPGVSYFLGQVSEQGWRGKSDLEDAFFSYRAAADEGYGPAKIAFASMALNQSKSRFRREAIEILQQAAANNDPLAAAPLARALFKGNGIKRNWIEANQVASKGELAGDPESLYLIGSWHRDGTAAQKDIPSALDYFDEAASLGVTAALFDRGALRLNKDAPQRWADPAAAVEDMLTAYVRTGSPGERKALFNRMRRLPSKSTRMDIQRALNDAGLDTGGIDGALGRKSSAALEAYRASQVVWPAKSE